MNSFANAYSYAQSVISNRRTEDYARFDNNYAVICKKLPKAADIKHQLDSLYGKLVETVFSRSNNIDFEDLKERQKQLSEKLAEILEKNDYPRDFLEVNYHCKKCSDTGVINGKTCECYNQLINEFNFSRLCGASQIEKCTFTSFSLECYPEFDNELGVSPKQKMKEIFEYCKNYSDNFSPSSKNIIMYGKTGLGKTHLSLAIAAEVSKLGFNVVYGSAQNLLRQSEKEYFSSCDDTMNSLLNCDLLVLDDLGTEFESKFNTSQVYNIINTRQSFSRPTIVSTNLSFSELQARYAQRVVSRLIGDYDCLMFIGNDVRQILSHE